MAETGRLTAPAHAARSTRVTLARVAIVAFILVTWEAVAASGLLFRDVVPSLMVIGRALIELLADKTYYWHLGVTAGEIGTRLAIGGIAGTCGRHPARRQSAAQPVVRGVSSTISARRRRSSSSR